MPSLLSSARSLQIVYEEVTMEIQVILPTLALSGALFQTATLCVSSLQCLKCGAVCRCLAVLAFFPRSLG